MKWPLLLICISIVFFSCEEEPLEEGIKTRVYGQILDTVNDLPIQGLKIRIAERIRQGTPSGTSYNFNGFLDSTVTDSAGLYDLTFETSGKGTIYNVEIQLQQDIFISRISERIADENIGSTEQINFDALQLFPVNLKLITPQPFEIPIFVNTVFSGDEIPGHPSFQTFSERRIWLDKNQDNVVYFRMENGNVTLRTQKTIVATGLESESIAEIELIKEDFN